MAPMLQSGTELATLMGGDACLSGFDRYYTESSCASFRDGILHSNGLLGGIRDFRTAALRILDKLAGDPSFSYDLTSGDGGLVHLYGSTYLRPALHEFSATSRVLAQAQLQMLDTVSIVVTVLLVVLLAVVYGLVYKPRVCNSLSEDTQSMPPLCASLEPISPGRQVLVSAGECSGRRHQAGAKLAAPVS